MKKLLILLFVVAAGSTFAQPANVVNAYNYLKSGELDKAKTAIDKAVEHPKTSVKEKTWRYRGDIYFAIMASTKPEYKALSDNPGQSAYESYIKAKELNSKHSWDKEIDKNLRLIQNMMLNDGVADFNEKKYDIAVAKFETSIAIAEHMGFSDSLAVFNAGLASERGEKYDNAIKWYDKCMEIGYRGSDCCGFIIFLLQKQDKNEEALKRVQACRASYPDNQNLIITELNYYLKDGDFEKAKANLEAAIANDPNNPILHFSVGTVMDNMGKKEEAEKSYLAAIKIKPEYFDPNYNLGAMYYNMAVEINNRANEEKDYKKAKAIQDEAGEVFKKALPYLEKARELKPEDRNTLQSLMQLYVRTGQTEKYNEVKAALGN